MEIIRILVASGNKEYSAALTASFSENSNISVLAQASDGNELIEQIKLFKPDVVVAELLLAYKDAIAVHSELSKINLDKMPAFFLILPYNDEGIVTEAVTAGISRILIKPCDIDVLINKIVNYDTSKSSTQLNLNRESDIELYVTNIMHKIGVPAHIKGYQYLRVAIMMAIEDMKVVNSITKILYPAVAKKFGTTTSRVERAMRHAIEVAWDRGDVEVLNSFFGYTISNLKGKPTNSEFISMIADHICLKKKLG